MHFVLDILKRKALHWIETEAPAELRYTIDSANQTHLKLITVDEKMGRRVMINIVGIT